MAKVKFLERCVTKEAAPQRFEAGRVYDLPDASAARWVVRGKAERVVDDEPPSAAPKPDPKPKGK